MNLARFEPGAAVYLFRGTGRIDSYTLTPARVVRQQARVTLETAEGLRFSKPARLVHAGYCAACEAPAVLSGAGLTCPRCGAQAEPSIPPLDLVAAWHAGVHHEEAIHLYHAIARGMLEGIPPDDARKAYQAWRDARKAAADGAPLSRERLLEARAWLLDMLERVDEELRDVDGTGLAIELPPAWQPPAEEAGDVDDPGGLLGPWLGLD